MSGLLKNWLSQNKMRFRLNSFFCLWICILFAYTHSFSQIGNYVSNGSFEFKYNCNSAPVINTAISWCNIGADTSALAGALYSIDCFFNAPQTDVGFQYPRTGAGFARTTFFCLNPCGYFASRGYPKNRLKARLTPNKTYCVSMYVSRQNECPYATSNLALFFGDNSTDTIKYCNGPITYLHPQVENPVTNIINDTLSWVPITGTFVATGNEKYLIIGNFKSNAATTASLVDNSWGTGVWAEYFVDDVSCIEVDLPAYAGPDKAVIPGDSVYIGRELDFAIDSGCTWYKLPNMSTPIVKASGLWVKPTSTSTYVVKQILDCSPLKYDTVVVYMNPLGIVSSNAVENDLKLFPNPAGDFLELNISDKGLFRYYEYITVYNAIGSVLFDEKINFDDGNLRLSTREFKNGVYYIRLSSESHQSFIKKFLVLR